MTVNPIVFVAEERRQIRHRIDIGPPERINRLEWVSDADGATMLAHQPDHLVLRRVAILDLIHRVQFVRWEGQPEHDRQPDQIPIVDNVHILIARPQNADSQVGNNLRLFPTLDAVLEAQIFDRLGQLIEVAHGYEAMILGELDSPLDRRAEIARHLAVRVDLIEDSERLGIVQSRPERVTEEAETERVGCTNVYERVRVLSKAFGNVPAERGVSNRVLVPVRFDESADRSSLAEEFFAAPRASRIR